MGYQYDFPGTKLEEIPEQISKQILERSVKDSLKEARAEFRRASQKKFLNESWILGGFAEIILEDIL